MFIYEYFFMFMSWQVHAGVYFVMYM